MKNNSLIKNALILGLITAMGPFAIDMYLPALPAIGTSMGDPKAAMFTLTAYFISFGVCQMLYGTISDMYGRRTPLLAGLVIFVVTGIGCALTTSIPALITLRFLQGVGGAAGVIITRAIVRDLYSGVEEVKMMSLLMLVFSVSPLLAPLSGSYIVEYLGWQSVFWTLAILGVAGIVLTLLTLSETWPKEKHIKAGFASMKDAFAILMRDRSFVGMTLIGAFGITSFFIYLGNSSFVMTDFYHLSPRAFSIIFSVNAAAFFAAAQANGPLSKRFGTQKLIIPAAGGCALCLITLAGLVLAGFTALPLMLSLMFLAFGCLGIVIPNIMVLAPADHGEIAGTAASLMNTVQMVIGSAAIGLSGLFVNGTPLPMALGMAGSAILTLACSLWTFAGHKIQEPA